MLHVADAGNEIERARNGKNRPNRRRRIRQHLVTETVNQVQKFVAGRVQRERGPGSPKNPKVLEIAACDRDVTATNIKGENRTSIGKIDRHRSSNDFDTIFSTQIGDFVELQKIRLTKVLPKPYLFCSSMITLSWRHE